MGIIAFEINRCKKGHKYIYPKILNFPKKKLPPCPECVKNETKKQNEK